MEFPDDWYEDIDGRDRMLDQDKVAVEIERLRAELAEARAEATRLRGYNEGLAKIGAENEVEINRLRKIEHAAHRWWRACHHENEETIELQAELLRVAVNDHSHDGEQSTRQEG